MAENTALLTRSDVKQPAPRSGAGWRVTGIVFAVLCTLVGGYTFAAWVQTTTRHETRTFPAGQLTALVVEGGTLDVTVSPAPAGGPVRAEARLRDRGREAWWRGDLRDGVLTVEAGCHNRWIANFCSVDVDITVPQGTAVHVDTGTGDVHVEGLKAPADIRTSTGDVLLDEVAGELAVQTGTGDVHADRADVGRARVQTRTGDVLLAFHRPPTTVDADARTGDILIEVPPDGNGYRVSTQAGTGDVLVGVPQDDASGRRLTARTRTGDVTLQ